MTEPDKTISSTRTVARIDWSELTTEFKAAIAAELGAGVTDWSSREEGFSPGLAARCRLSDGRRVFVKALPAALLGLAGRSQRHEIETMRSLPVHAPCPKMLGAKSSMAVTRAASCGGNDR